MLKTMAAPVDLARQAFNVGGRISLANIGPIGIQNAGKSIHTGSNSLPNLMLTCPPLQILKLPFVRNVKSSPADTSFPEIFKDGQREPLKGSRF